MSLINDALKRARDAQPANPPPAADSRSTVPTRPPLKLPPLTPVESAPRGGHGWLLALAVVLLVAAAGLFAGLKLSKSKNPPATVMAEAPKPLPPPPAQTQTFALKSPTAKTAPAPAPAKIVSPPPPVRKVSPAVSNATPAVRPANPPLVSPPEQLPKVQGVIFNSTRPLAIVDGKMVGVGDDVGPFRVKAISQADVTFQRRDGSVKRLRIGE